MGNQFTFINARVIDPRVEIESSDTLTINDGLIEKRDGGIKGKVIDCGGMCLAPGIVDIGVKVCEPGEKHKESFRSASNAAATGGVTSLVTRPDTKPAIDNPELLEFFKNRGKEFSKVRVFPTASLTKKNNGKKITEIGFLHDGGAVAFTDGFNSIPNTKTFHQILKYASDFDTLIIGHPQDHFLTKNTSASSGVFASIKGLSSSPNIAEKIGIERDTALINNLNIRYHADQVTTKIGLDVLRQAKKSNSRITAGTSIHHLLFNELDIGNYRTFFKLKPPLRSNIDREALIEAIREGLIDNICSMHTPQDEESKRLPFEEAAPGAVGLETILQASLSLYHNKVLSLNQIFRLLALNPAEIIKTNLGSLDEGQPADIIIFDPDKPVKINRFKFQSKSQNTPFDGFNLQGENLLTVVKGEIIFKKNSFKV